MADNQRQIQATVDIDVEPSLKALRELKKQLRDTAAGTEDFRKLQEKINDTEDALRSARVGADNFAEILGTLPGPIGDIGSKVGGTIQTLKQFSSIKLTDLRSSVADFGKDLLDVARNIGNITGITKVYTVINNALSRSFVAVGVGEQAAAAGARAFAAALTATGIGAIVVAVGLLVEQLFKYINSTDEATETTDSLTNAIKRQTNALNVELQAIDDYVKTQSLRAKLQGKSEAEINKIVKEGGKERLAALKAEQESIYRQQDELNKNTAINAAQREKDRVVLNERLAEVDKQVLSQITQNEITALEQQVAAKEKADNKKVDSGKAAREKELEDAKKNEREAFLLLMNERDREEYLINEKYASQQAAAVKAGQDTKLLKEAQQKELKELSIKFAKEDYDIEVKNLELKNAQGLLTEEEYQKSLYDLSIKYGQNIKDAEIAYETFKTEKRKQRVKDNRDLEFQDLQNQLDALDLKNQALENDFADDIFRLENKKILLQQQKDLELSNTELTQKEKNDIIKKYGQEEVAIDKEITQTKKAELEARKALQLQYTDVVGQLGAVLQQAAGENKELAIAGLVIEQAAGVARIIINTQAAAAKAGYLTPVGIATLVAGALGVASAVIATKKGIDQIKAQQVPGAKGVSSGGGGAIQTTFTAGPQIATPQIQSGAGAQNPTAQIAETLAQSSGKPVKAYVVAQDVSSVQAFDRRTNVAATF